VAAILGAAVSGTFIDRLGIDVNMPVSGTVMIATVFLTVASLRKKPVA